MKPLSTTIHGFGPYYNEATIDWSAIRPPVAIVADSGSGKSFLIGALFFALYGEWPDGTDIATSVSAGFAGTPFVAAIFEHDGHEYKAERSLGSKHQAWIECDGECIAGPNVKDVAATVERLFGGKELAKYTWMAAQGEVAAFCNARPVERGNELKSLMGLDPLADLSKRIGKARLETSRLADDRETVNAAAGARIAALAKEASARLTAASDAVARAKAAVELRCREDTAAQAKLDRAREEERKAREESDRIAELHAAWVARKRAAEDAQARLDAARNASARLAEFEQAADRLPILRKQIAGAREKRKALGDDIEKRRAAWTAYGSLVAARKALADAEAASQASAEDMALAETVKERRDASTQADTKLLGTLNGNSLASAEITRLEKERDSLAETAKNGEPPTSADKTVCSDCIHFKRFAGLPAVIAGVETRISWHRGRIVPGAEVDRLRETARVAALDLSNAAAAATRVEAARVAHAKLDPLRKAAADAATTLSELTCEPADAYNPDAEKVKGLDLRAEIACIESQIQTDASEETTLAVLASRLSEAREAAAKVSVLEAEAKAAADAVGNEPGKPPVVPPSLVALEREAKARELAAARASLSTAEREHAAAEESVAAANRATDDHEAKVAEAREIRTRVNVLTKLEWFYGPKGVSQLLLDEALSRLSALTDEFFSTCADQRFSVHIPTQIARADGTVAEGLPIMVRDNRLGGVEREFATYSGGEKALIATAMRPALETWISEMRGGVTGLYIGDEFADGQHFDRAVEMVETIQRTGDATGRYTIIVTHNPSIAALCRSQVRLTNRGLGGVDVEVVA